MGLCQGGDVLGHPQGHFVGDHVASLMDRFVVPECEHNNVNKVGVAGARYMVIGGREKVTRCMDVFDSA